MYSHKQYAENLLRQALGNPSAQFRHGQWEAIDALVNRRKKLLVVQPTGWGKSIVYFIATRILRNQGAGLTLIISPLLALMRNQIEAATRLGIRAASINSTNEKDHQNIFQATLNDEVDALLISPERLQNETFRQDLLQTIAHRVGLLVVDEAHCISDWGHDFRPDYRRIANLLRQLPPNVPVLGTTATANKRVMDDIKAQFGDKIEIQRGSLVRKSLVLQTLRLQSQAERLAWLASHLPQLPGTGIVYVLTKRDAEQVAAWLASQGIAAKAYHSDVHHEDFEDSNAYRQYLEDLLQTNRIKALVATTALGMGYDKPDVGFVIHYQAPGSIVAYYQQVGRAGRAIDTAYGVLLTGQEDEIIHEYFRHSAMPDERHVEAILTTLAKHDGLSIPQLEQKLNLRRGQIRKVLNILSVESPAPIIHENGKWRRTPVPFRLDRQRYERLARQRELEWQEVQEYIDTSECLMAFLQIALDDPHPAECGRCASCKRKSVVSAAVAPTLVRAARSFLKAGDMPLQPKKWFPPGAFVIYEFSGTISQELRASEGRILSRWGDGGWGYMVAQDKHRGRFRDELVEAAARMIRQRWKPTPPPLWVTCIPSLRHPSLVPDFARRLAGRLGLPFISVICKVQDNEPQKLQQNSFHQCRNLDGVFEISGNIPQAPVLLVDDIVDSGYTMAVLAALLRRAGSGEVYPLALASTSVHG